MRLDPIRLKELSQEIGQWNEKTYPILGDQQDERRLMQITLNLMEEFGEFIDGETDEEAADAAVQIILSALELCHNQHIDPMEIAVAVDAFPMNFSEDLLIRGGKLCHAALRIEQSTGDNDEYRRIIAKNLRYMLNLLDRWCQCNNIQGMQLIEDMAAKLLHRSWSGSSDNSRQISEYRSETEEKMQKLFFGGLSWNTTEEMLRDACKEFGETTEVRIPTDRETGRSRGFGFVTFVDKDDADRAKEALDGSTLDNRAIRVDWAAERERPQRQYGDRRNDRDDGPRRQRGNGSNQRSPRH